MTNRPRHRVLAALGLVLLALGGCALRGTGEPPDWDPPETWREMARGGTASITIDADGRAAVADLRQRDGACSSTSEVVLTGDGTWDWAGYGRIHIEVGGRLVRVVADPRFGELDWDKLVVLLCDREYGTGSENYTLLIHGRLFGSR